MYIRISLHMKIRVLLAVCVEWSCEESKCNHSCGGVRWTGRVSSVVRRPIEIVSNPRHNRGRTVRRPLNGMGLKGKVAPLGVEPRASGLSRQCSATELRRPDGNHPPSKPLLAYFERLLKIRVLLAVCVKWSCEESKCNHSCGGVRWTGRDSSVVRRPIEMVSNQRHNWGRTVRIFVVVRNSHIVLFFSVGTLEGVGLCLSINALRLPQIYYAKVR